MGDIPNLPNAPQSPFEAPAERRPRNYADSPVIRARIKNEILPIVREVRDRRGALNITWANQFKVWDMELENEDVSGYIGRSNIYDPTGRQAIETIVTQLVAATFPGDENFGVKARNPELQEYASDLRELLKKRIDSDAKVRAKAEDFYRQLVIAGNSPVKLYYKRQPLNVFQRDRSPNAKIPGAFGAKETFLYDAPVFEVVDILNWYGYPENADDLDDCELVFEDLTISLGKLRQRVREKVYFAEDPEALLKKIGSQSDAKAAADDAKLQGQSISSPSGSSGLKGRLGRVDLTEVYVDFDPAAESEEQEKGPVPFLITMTADGEVLRAIRNPWWHQRPCYRLGRIGTQKGRLYGTGIAKVIRPLNLLLNDQTNQGNDCATYALNPIAKVNPNLLIGGLAPIEPGVQYEMLDVNQGLAFDRPPVELIQASSVLRTDTRSQIFEAAGAPPVLQGGSAPGRAFRTATGVGTAQTNARAPLLEVVKRCEADVWQPMLFMFYMLDQQFSEGAIELFVPDAEVVKLIDPRLLAGDWLFEWLASTQMANQQIRTEQYMKAVEVLSASGVQQALQARGRGVDLEPLLRRLFIDGFGFKDFEKVVVPLAPPSGVAPPGAGAGPPASAPLLDALRGENPMLDGNGEFGAMRMGANQIAGAFGRSAQGMSRGEMMGMMGMPNREGEDE